MGWIKNSLENQEKINNNVLDDHEEFRNYRPWESQYGPPEKKDITIVIPITKIWNWFRKRKKQRS